MQSPKFITVLHISFLIIECYHLVLCAGIVTVVVVLGLACEKFVFKLLQVFFSLATQLFYNSPRIWSPLLTSEQSLVTDAALKFHVTKVLRTFLVHVVIIIMLNHLEEIQEHGTLYCMFSLGFLLFSVYSQQVGV